MIKKTIKYADPFTDDEVEEDFYFHLTRAELIELEMSEKGGLKAALERIVKTEDQEKIVREFKRIIMMAYGVRSDDGRRFIKNDAVREEFETSEAYSALFMELISDDGAAIEFVNGMIPANISAEAAKIAGIEPRQIPIIAVVSEPDVITKKEFNEISNDEMPALMERIKRGEVIFQDEPSPAE